MAVNLHKLDVAYSQQKGVVGAPLNEHGVDYIRRVPHRLAATLRVQREARREVDADGWLSDAGKRESQQQIKEWGRARIDSIQMVFDHHAEQVRKTLPPINTMSAEQQAAFNAKAPRLWERVRYQLDAGVDITTVIKNADRDTLQVIEEEIGAYNLARNPADERMAKLQTEAARELVDQHRPVVSTPEEAKQLTQRGEIEAGINNVTGAFDWARMALDDQSVNLLPAFERGEAVNVYGE